MHLERRARGGVLELLEQGVALGAFGTEELIEFPRAQLIERKPEVT